MWISKKEGKFASALSLALDHARLFCVEECLNASSSAKLKALANLPSSKPSYTGRYL